MSGAPSPGPVTAEAGAIELLARVLYAEAGACPARAIEALAAVVLNRAAAARSCPVAAARYASGSQPASLARAVIAVVRAPFQFPVRHPRHPQHARFMCPPESDPALALCRRVAQRALAGALPDATAGARLWHDARRLPAWAIGRVPHASLGGLCFYGEDAGG
ncbi:MAG: cell wall hydrolase [Rubritepida sp.]|jgi:spore germination cell wall hydrolase CwlJ-like protein|nr:cell wall hydrolase [Rubritepida sp.]